LHVVLGIGYLIRTEDAPAPPLEAVIEIASPS